MQPRNPDYQQEKIQIITRKKNKEINIESEEPTRKVEVLRNPRRVCSHRESHEHSDHRNPQCPWACETRSWRLRTRTAARSESPPESGTCSTCKLSPGSTSLLCFAWETQMGFWLWDLGVSGNGDLWVSGKCEAFTLGGIVRLKGKRIVFGFELLGFKWFG